MIWRCACDFFKVLQKFEMVAMHELHIFLRAQDLKIEVRKIHNMQVILLNFFKYLWQQKTLNLFYSGGDKDRISVLLFLNLLLL